jgi:hypothetical protein
MPTTYRNPAVAETNLYNHYRAALQELARSETDILIRTGQILSEAISRLPRGQFESLLDEMKIERSMASRWMAIADTPPLLHSVQKLPPHYSTLYEMTKIPAERLEELIADGTFTVSTTREQVQALLPKPKKRSKRRTKKSTDVKPMPAWERLRLYVRDIRSELVDEAQENPAVVKAHGRDIASIMEDARKQAHLADRAMPMRDHVEREEPLTEADMEPAVHQSPPTAPDDDDAATPRQTSSNYRDDASEFPELIPKLDRRRPAPPADDGIVFEEDVPEDDRSSGRPEDDDERREYEEFVRDRWN